MNLLDIKLDIPISKFIVDNVGLLKYVHPNVITLSGMISNFVIYYYIKKKNTNKYLLSGLIMYRCIADICDGMVARKFGKVSKFGGTLDTISDFHFYLIAVSFLKKLLRLHKSFYGLCIFLFLIFMKYHDTWSDHSNFKKSPINACVVENTIVYYSIFVMLYLKFGYKRLF